MYLSTNPGGVGHAWFKALFVEPYRKGTEGKTRFIPATVDDNAFATAEYREFLDGLVGWLKRALPYGARQWDQEQRRWLVSCLYAAKLLAGLAHFGFTLQDDRDQQASPFCVVV